MLLSIALRKKGGIFIKNKLFFLITIILFGILNVHAEEVIIIKDISSDSKTESLTINNPTINNNIIDTNIVLHNLNDFIYLNK